MMCTYAIMIERKSKEREMEGERGGRKKGGDRGWREVGRKQRGLLEEYFMQSDREKSEGLISWTETK